MNNKITIIAERDSVCMADDCMAPNSKTLTFESSCQLQEVLSALGNYVPKFSGKQHTIWGIECDGVPIAFLESNGGGYRGITTGKNLTSEKLNNKKIYCRYFFDCGGSLSSNLSAFCKSTGKGSLSNMVRSYYKQPESERWGWHW